MALLHSSSNGGFTEKVFSPEGSTKSVLSDRFIVCNKSRTQLLHRIYLLYETGCRIRRRKHLKANRKLWRENVKKA